LCGLPGAIGAKKDYKMGALLFSVFHTDTCKSMYSRDKLIFRRRDKMDMSKPFSFFYFRKSNKGEFCG